MTEQIDTGSPALDQHIIWNYEYDKEGNWIKKSQTLFDSVPTLIQERVIEYY